MRKKHEEQLMLTFIIPNNKLGKELKSISHILDANKHCKWYTKILQLTRRRLDGVDSTLIRS